MMDAGPHRGNRLKIRKAIQKVVRVIPANSELNLLFILNGRPHININIGIDIADVTFPFRHITIGSNKKKGHLFNYLKLVLRSDIYSYMSIPGIINKIFSANSIQKG